MTGNWQGPQPVLKVAFEKGPFDTTSGGDFTDISSRIISIELERGRSDPLQPFGVGTLTVELDNSDRLLDPSNPSALNYTAGNKGLPLCPVTLDITWNSSTTRRYTGYLGPDCWPTDTAPYGPTATVTLSAMDLLGFSPELPSEAWHCMLLATRPDFWLPMDHGFPVLVNGSTVANRSGSGGSATLIEADANLSRMSDELGSFAPGLKFSADHKLKIAAADAFPDGDDENVTMCGWIRWDTAHAAGEETTIVRLTNPGGSTKRFLLVLNEDGDAVAEWYDSGGSSLDSVTIAKPGGRWDDNNPVFWIVRFVSGNNCEVWINGISDTTASAASTVYESDIYLGPSDLDPVIDEFALWRGSARPVDNEIDGFNLAATSQGIRAWHGDNWLGDGSAPGSRIDHWYTAAGRSVTVDDTSEWHLPTDDGDSGFWGIGTFGNIPTNLAEALRDTVGPDGAVWVTKDGYYRLRTVDALTDATYAADYATSSADLTDDAADLTPPDYRHAGVVLGSVQMDRIINRVEGSFVHLIDLGPPLDTANMTIAPQDDDSIARYGKRIQTHQFQWYGWERVAAWCDSVISRYADPTVQVQEVALDLIGDDELTTWWVETCELEKAVTVTYTPYGESAVTISGLNIQRERLVWTPTSMQVVLGLAKS